jgi:hypothetical protein
MQQVEYQSVTLVIISSGIPMQKRVNEKLPEDVDAELIPSFPQPNRPGTVSDYPQDLPSSHKRHLYMHHRSMTPESQPYRSPLGNKAVLSSLSPGNIGTLDLVFGAQY